MTGFSDQFAEANVMAAFVYLRMSGQTTCTSSDVCMDNVQSELTKKRHMIEGLDSYYSVLSRLEFTRIGVMSQE